MRLIPFVCSEDGYHFEISLAAENMRKIVACKEFLAYLFMIWHDSFSYLPRSQNLFHQFVMGIYVKMRQKSKPFIEQARKNYELNCT